MTKVVLEVLGRSYELPRREISEVPASALDGIGYVEFESSTVLKRAEYRGGCWVDHRKRPFAEMPVAWYSLAGMLDV